MRGRNTNSSVSRLALLYRYPARDIHRRGGEGAEHNNALSRTNKTRIRTCKTPSEISCFRLTRARRMTDTNSRSASMDHDVLVCLQTRSETGGNALAIIIVNPSPTPPAIYLVCNIEPPFVISSIISQSRLRKVFRIRPIFLVRACGERFRTEQHIRERERGRRWRGAGTVRSPPLTHKKRVPTSLATPSARTLQDTGVRLEGIDELAGYFASSKTTTGGWNAWRWRGWNETR